MLSLPGEDLASSKGVKSMQGEKWKESNIFHFMLPHFHLRFSKNRTIYWIQATKYMTSDYAADAPGFAKMHKEIIHRRIK